MNNSKWISKTWPLLLVLGAFVVPRLLAQKSPDSLKSLAALAEQNKAVVVDVREEDEISDGMAKGARWMPTSKIATDSPEWKAFLNTLPQGEAKKTTPIAIYCQAGGRAGKVAKELQKLGYKAENIGGFPDWQAAGLPTQKGYSQKTRTFSP